MRQWVPRRFLFSLVKLSKKYFLYNFCKITCLPEVLDALGFFSGLVIMQGFVTKSFLFFIFKFSLNEIR